MWAPDQALNLYLDGDKSKVIDIDNPDVTSYPRFVTSPRHVADLEPGDILFIPALWYFIYVISLLNALK
jgi:tRNA wybutosine-synthesizing protein 5